MGTSTARRLGSGVFLLLALLLPLDGVAQHFPPDEDLRLMLRYLVEDGEAPGVALGVVGPDGSARAVAHGVGADEAALSPRSVLDLGSLTMAFTATLLAEMVERGEVSLEDPAAGYLPGTVRIPAPGGYEMTLGDLATHRSGLPAGPRAGRSGMTEEAIFELVAEAELRRPGVRYEFSTVGYALLGQALAGAAAVPYADLLRERVLEPLGMEATGYPEDEAGVVSWGATGLRSSAADMLRFLRANVHPEASPLGAAVRRAREIRVDRGDPDEAVGYGFSWRTQSLARQPPIVTHGGTSETSTTMIAFDPEQGIGTVLLAARPGFNDFIGRDLLFFEPPTSKTRIRVDGNVLREYEGVYEVGPDHYTAAHDRGRYFIRLEDEGHLTYQPRGRARTPLYAESDSTFYMLRGPYTLTFAPLEDGVRLVIHVDEREPEVPARSWTAWKATEDVPPPAVVAGHERSWSTWGAGVWALVVLLVIVVAGVISRPLWSRGGSARATGAA